MLVNADGTATLLQDTSSLGMQLQIQNVNGQNLLTPVQSNSVLNNTGQGVLTAGSTGMVLRPASQGKILQQQHSPGSAQFLSPNGGQFVVNGAQFSGQLSPLVANVNPSQQMSRFYKRKENTKARNKIVEENLKEAKKLRREKPLKAAERNH